MTSDSLTPAERTMRARKAVHTSWSRTPDRAARTAPARAAMLAKFEREVDPDGVLSPEERTKRAKSAKYAYFQSMAMKSAQARRRRP